MWGLFVALIFAIITGCWASKKNRNALGWGIFGFFFPLIALIVLAFMKPIPAAPANGCGCGCDEKKD